LIVHDSFDSPILSSLAGSPMKNCLQVALPIRLAAGLGQKRLMASTSTTPAAQTMAIHTNASGQVMGCFLPGVAGGRFKLGGLEDNEVSGTERDRGAAIAEGTIMISRIPQINGRIAMGVEVGEENLKCLRNIHRRIKEIFS